jgi:hypothetical protein
VREAHYRPPRIGTLHRADRMFDMRKAVFALDRYLRRRMGLSGVCDDPRCLFRMRRGAAPYDLVLDGDRIPAGAPVVELHFWNEHFPPVPEGGPTLRWGVQGQKMVTFSCHALAHRLVEDGELTDVRAVGGTTPLFAVGDGSGWERIFLRLGFRLSPHRGGRGEIWERLYAWIVMWAFNVGASGPGRLRDVRRTDFWVATGDFVERHAANTPRETVAAGPG